MKIMDPHCHMVSRVTDDYERMALAGIRVVVEPAFWMGEPRKRAGTFFDYFDHITGYERQRAGLYLIDHYAAVSVNPRESNQVALTEEVLRELPRWLDRPGVVAVGEVGFDDITDAEEASLRRQLELAAEWNLPVIVHTPHVDKLRGLRRTLEVLRAARFPPEKTVLDHTTEETVELSRDSGAWCGFTVYNVTKLTPERAVNIIETYGTERMLINSSCDWGPSDPLNVPKTALEMRRRGFDDTEISTLVWDNPMTFYRQSGRLKPQDTP
jgi:predicted metal-dependent TIM-barrel fold hydrolase